MPSGASGNAGMALASGALRARLGRWDREVGTLARRLLAGLVAVLAILGMRLFDKGTTHDEVHARLLELCAEDEGCEAAVRRHYDACFEEAFEGGSRRRPSRLDVDTLVQCVNTRAHVPYFTVRQETN
jgi:hypothetical protein